MCVALLSSSRLIVSHWLTSREMRLCIWRRGLGRGSRSCTQRPPCLRLGSRQAPPSRFGHVFVGIDASSKLLIWGGLNCDACPSQTLWFTGVRARFLYGSISMGFAILSLPVLCWERHSTPFSLICAMVLHATPSCYLLLFTTTCGNDHEQNMWVRESNCNLVVCLFVF